MHVCMCVHHIYSCQNMHVYTYIHMYTYIFMFELDIFVYSIYYTSTTD